MSGNRGTDLHKRYQESLHYFLETELQAAETFCRMTESHHSTERRAELHRKIDEVITTARHLAEKLEDESVRKTILHRVDEIERRAKEARSEAT